MAMEDQDILDQIAELRRQRAAELQAMQSDNNPLGLIVSGALGGIGDAFTAGAGGQSNYATQGVNAYQTASKGQRDMRLKALEGTGEDIKALHALAQSRATDRRSASTQAELMARTQMMIDAQNARQDKEIAAGKYSQRDAAVAQRAEQLAAKKEEKELALAVPGFSRTGEVLPKAEEAQKFREASAEADQLTKKLNRMQELVKQYGSYEYGGPGGTEMESLATEIQLLAKSPSMYGLGVLTGPDLTLLQKITADPSSFSSLFSNNDNRAVQINSQINSIKDKLTSKAKSLGYVANATEQKTTPPPVDNGGSWLDPTANASSAPVGHPDPAKEARRQQLLNKAQGL